MRLVRLHRFFSLDNDLEDQSEYQKCCDLSLANTIIENDRIFYSLIKNGLIMKINQVCIGIKRLLNIG